MLIGCVCCWWLPGIDFVTILEFGAHERQIFQKDMILKEEDHTSEREWMRQPQLVERSVFESAQISSRLDALGRFVNTDSYNKLPWEPQRAWEVKLNTQKCVGRLAMGGNVYY